MTSPSCPFVGPYPLKRGEEGLLYPRAPSFCPRPSLNFTPPESAAYKLLATTLGDTKSHGRESNLGRLNMESLGKLHDQAWRWEREVGAHPGLCLSLCLDCQVWIWIKASQRPVTRVRAAQSCLLDYRMSPGLEVRVRVGGGYRNCGTVNGKDSQGLTLYLKPHAAKACFPRCMVTCMESFVLPLS